MTIQKVLKQAVLQLKEKVGDSACLDVEILLAHTIKKPKEFLYTRPEKKLTRNQLQIFSSHLKRRLKHEPIAYITGHKEFFSLDFLVNKHVLIPRPETELLVEEVLKIIHQLPMTDYQLLDIGTGSGCIAIALAKHLPRAKIIAIDSSKKALQLAQQNAHRHQVARRIMFYYGNLLVNPKSKIQNLKSYNLQLTTYNLIIANLPYISTSEYQKLAPDIKNYEPKQALIAGPDGLKYYRQLFKQLQSTMWLHCYVAMWLLIEISPTQTNSIKKLIKKYFPTAQIQIKKDLANKNRVVIIQNLKSTV